MLGEMIQYYKDFLDQHRNDPALQARPCRDVPADRNLTYDQGNKVDALHVVRQAVQYFEQLPAGAGDDRRIRFGLYRALHRMAVLESDLGGLESGLRDYQSARRNYQRGFQILEGIVQKEPRNFELKRELAAVLGNFANLSLIVGDKAEARRAYLQALDIQKDLIQKDPADATGVFKNDLALTYHNLAFLADTEEEKPAILERRSHSGNSLSRCYRAIPYSGATWRGPTRAWRATNSISGRPRTL